METKQTHWKRLTNPNYIGAYSLNPGEDLVIKIKSVSKEMVMDSSGKQEECVVAQIVDNKPFILNKTNMKMISKVLGSPFIENWAGKTLTIYAAKVKAFGDTVEALRIREQKPALPELKTESEAWNKAVKYISEGGDFTSIQKKYTLSQKDKDKLVEDAATLIKNQQ